MIILLLLILDILNLVNCYNCKYKEQEQDFHFDFQQSVHEHFQPIRILADYSNIQVESPIVRQIIDTCIQYIEEIYKIQRSPSYPEFKHLQKCGDINVPQYQDAITDYDLVIYVGANYSNDTYVALSTSCLKHASNNRNIAAMISINLKYFEKKQLNQADLLNWLGIIVHEFTHILGFHAATFAQHKMLIKHLDGRYSIKSGKLLEFARNYYNCEHIHDLPLENDGVPGTIHQHWERTTFGNEVMTGTEQRIFSYSAFTMLALEGLGLYQVDLEKADLFEWGHNSGCQLAHGGCSKDIQCRLSRDATFCGLGYNTIERCSEKQKLSKCPLPNIYGECRWFGKRCFDGMKNKAKCVDARCDGNSIIFAHDDKEYQCEYDNQVHGELICPIIQEFCQQECNGRGKKVRGRCICGLGFRGEECENFAFQGVFKGISENLNVGIGKKFPESNYNQKEHHFNIGWKPWQQSNETVYEVDYNPKKAIEKQESFANKHPPTIHIDHINVPYNKDNHFNSEYKNYKQYQDAQPAKPHRDKLTLLATQIVLGEDKIHYQTAQQLGEVAKPPQRVLKYHEKPERFDIIANTNVDKERLQKASQFDYWIPERDKKHISFNKTEIPEHKLGRRDPITNRFIY